MSQTPLEARLTKSAVLLHKSVEELFESVEVDRPSRRELIQHGTGSPAELLSV